MTNENWNPGHAINKGYPYNGVVSKKMLPNRPKLYQNEEGKTEIVVDLGRYPKEKEALLNDKQANRTAFEDFLLHRCYDFQEALTVAEGQIMDILEEHPFLPENFGFFLAHKHRDITEPPVRIYASKYSPEYTLFRKPAKDSSLDVSIAQWTLMRKKEDNTFQETDILIPSSRFAYAIFVGLGIKVAEDKASDDSGGDGMEATVPETDSSLLRHKFTHKVLFTRQDAFMAPNQTFQSTRTVRVNAKNDKEALTQAKFILETDPDLLIHKLGIIEFHELSIVK